MIGTQMIAKGHDFPNVTLTAIVNPDITLALPISVRVKSYFH